MANDDFQRRLDRIAEKTDGGDLTADGFEPPIRSNGGQAGGGGLFRPAFLINLLLLAVAGAVVLSLTGQISGRIGVATGTYLPTVDGAPIKADDAAARFGAGKLLPIDALPDASEGWVRVMQADAIGGGLLDRLAASWPADAQPLADNLGYKRLEHFAKMNAQPDVEARMNAKRHASALYLSHSGQFLSVGLTYRGELKALGGPDQPRAWVKSLEEETKGAIQFNQIMETVDLAGHQVINRVKAPGKSLVERPLSEGLDSPTGMRLKVALTSRAVLMLEGIATGRQAAAIIGAADATRMP